ncbi:MAG: exonuclease [Cyanothece sp. SIO1E1]|nr:exonuclease [Cyanothece sp. SIO1E1]
MLQLLPIADAKQTRQRGGNYFTDAQGVRLASVTTILNATKSQADREALARWRSRVGFAQANRISRAASIRGSQTHKQIKHHLLEQAIPCPEAVQPYWHSVEPVLQEINDVKLIESPVLHYQLGYAGKVDCVASYRGVPCVCDWKTADQPKQSVERLYDGPVQLAAYCGAFNHYYEHHGIKLRHALLVVAIAHQPAEIFWFEPETVMTYWQQWLERVMTFNRFIGTGPTTHALKQNIAQVEGDLSI